MFLFTVVKFLLALQCVGALSDPTKHFLNWLVENGADISKADWPSYATASGIRGSVANVNIKATEPYCKIPSKLWLWEPNFIHHVPQLATYLKEHKVETSSTVRLCLFMLHELTKGRKSFYYPMLSFLNEVDLLTQWSDQELDLFDDEGIIEHTKTEQKSIYDYYNSFVVNKFLPAHTDIYQPNQFNYYKYKIILDCIYSRGFGQRDEYDEDGVALIPFAESFNHANVNALPANQYDSNTNQTNFYIYMGYTGRDELQHTESDIQNMSPGESYIIHKGDELYFNYGHVDNHDLLFGYGFNTLDNLWEKYAFSAEIEVEENELYKKKNFILFEFHQFYLHEAYSFRRLHFPFEALCVARLMEADDNIVHDIIVKQTQSVTRHPVTNEVIDESPETIQDHYNRPLDKKINTRTLDVTVHSYMSEVAGISRLWEDMNTSKYIYEGNDEISSLDELLNTYYHIYHGNYTLWNTGDLASIVKPTDEDIRFPLCNMSALYNILGEHNIIDVMFNIPPDPITPDYITVYEDISQRYLNMSKYMSQTCIRPFRLMSILIYHITYKRIFKINFERITRLRDWLSELSTNITSVIQNTKTSKGVVEAKTIKSTILTPQYLNTTANYLYFTPTFLTPDLTHPEFIPILSTARAKAHLEDDPDTIITHLSLLIEYVGLMIDKTIQYHLGNTYVNPSIKKDEL